MRRFFLSNIPVYKLYVELCLIPHNCFGFLRMTKGASVGLTIYNWICELNMCAGRKSYVQNTFLKRVSEQKKKKALNYNANPCIAHPASLQIATTTIPPWFS